MRFVGPHKLRSRLLVCAVLGVTGVLGGADLAHGTTPPGSSLVLSPTEVTIQAGAAPAYSPRVTATITLPGYTGNVHWAWSGAPSWTYFFVSPTPTPVASTGTASLTFSSFAAEAVPGTYVKNVIAHNPWAGVSVSTPLTIHVVPDTTPPSSFDVPEDITVDATSPAGAVVNFTAPTRALDNVGSFSIGGYVPVVCDGRSGDTYPVGTTTVTCTAEDAAGNTTDNAFTITVNAFADTEAPTVSCVAATNPDGSTVPATSAGFRRLIATDAGGLDRLEIEDTGSSFVSAPFASGDVVHVRSTPNADPAEARPGAGALVARLRLTGQARLVAYDLAGNRSDTLCPVVAPER